MWNADKQTVWQTNAGDSPRVGLSPAFEAQLLDCAALRRRKLGKSSASAEIADRGYIKKQMNFKNLQICTGSSA